MSQANVETVRSMYDAFARGDVPFVLGLLSPRIEWIEAENFPYADRGPYIGPQAVLSGIFARLATEWDGFAAVPQELLDAGDTVVCLGRYRGTYQATGTFVDAQMVHVFRMEAGRIRRFEQYTDTAQFQRAMSQAAKA